MNIWLSQHCTIFLQNLESYSYTQINISGFNDASHLMVVFAINQTHDFVMFKKIEGRFSDVPIVQRPNLLDKYITSPVSIYLDKAITVRFSVMSSSSSIFGHSSCITCWVQPYKQKQQNYYSIQQNATSYIQINIESEKTLILWFRIYGSFINWINHETLLCTNVLVCYSNIII